MSKILYVDDDSPMTATVIEWLTRDGHTVVMCGTGDGAARLLSESDYDVVLLGWALPGMTGPEVCRWYRRRGGTGWVIIIASDGQVENIETGLSEGADGFIVRPLDLRELSARVKSMLRRGSSAYISELRIDDVLLNPSRATMSIYGSEIPLMPKEAALLEFLMRNPNRKFSSRSLLSAVWPSEKATTEGSVRTYMCLLRRKLQASGRPQFIKTVLKGGYWIESKPLDMLALQS